MKSKQIENKRTAKNFSFINCPTYPAAIIDYGLLLCLYCKCVSTNGRTGKFDYNALYILDGKKSIMVAIIATRRRKKK